ncbi:MAG: hypothetical protein IJH91_09520 [Mogibacterium sp.]|nr:hypothetical protein [Mogibacterium sp.]
MEMIGYLGRKVDVVLKDKQHFSGYVFDCLEAEDSDIGEDCIDLAPLDSECIIAIPIKDILTIVPDDRYRTFDFRS